MGPILDTSVIVRAERRGHSVAEVLKQIRGTHGEAEVGSSVVTIAELAPLSAERQSGKDRSIAVNGVAQCIGT